MAARRRILAGVAVLVTLLSLVACSKAVPYDDSASTGALALVDQNGKAVTTGSVNDKPFVRAAVSLVKAPSPYDKPGRKAALMAFQPRKGVSPALWGGDFMTGSTTYENPNFPTAHGTDEDISLANFIAEFPPQWNGMIQLRIYLGAPQEPGLTSSYVTADIKVSGDTWTLVRGSSELPAGATGGGS